jgi:hypothetical protein
LTQITTTQDLNGDGIMGTFKERSDINWNKWGLWLATLVNQATIVYPGLTEQDVVNSIMDGTFWVAAVKVFVSLITARAAVLAGRSLR